MPITNPFGSTGAPAPAPTPGVVNPFAEAAHSAIQGLNPVDDAGGNSIGGFLGNVVGGIKGIVGGVASLIGQGVHDIIQLAHGPSALEHPENWELFQTAKALPAALSKDYQSRYGWEDFSHGDIWGGIKDIGAGLYDNPIAYIGDALMVGGAASKVASAGRLADLTAAGVEHVPALARALPDLKLLPDALAEPILGPMGREAMSLTGSVSESTQLGQSINPVTRFMQNKMIDAFSLSPDKAIAWADLRNPGNPEAAVMDLGAYRRATESITMAQARGIDILRPTISRGLENRFTSRTMGIMGINSRIRSSRLVADTVDIIDNSGLDDAGKAILPDVIQGTVDMEGPSMRPPMRIIDDAFESQYAGPTPVVTDGFDGRFTEGVARNLEPDQWRRIDPASKDAVPDITPHDTVGVRGERIAVFSPDPTLSDAPAILKQVEEATGHRLVSVSNDFANPGSYDGYHGWFEDPETGRISEVSVTTKTLWNEQAKWAGNQRQIAALEAEADSITMEMRAAEDAAAATGQVADTAALEGKLVGVTDELEAAQAANNYAFRFTRRAMNAAVSGAEYPEVLQVADKLSSLTHAGTAKVELAHGALTFRKMWDRAFLPMRANRHAVLMNEIEKDLADYFSAIQESGPKPAGLSVATDVSGVPQEASLLGAVEIISNRLGTGHPAIVKAIEDALGSSKVDEIIPFQTEDVMPAFLDETQPALGGTLATGEKTIPANWMGSTDPAQAARLVRNKIYALTHESIVVNGEFPTFSWKDMLAQVEADPFQEVPTYYAHIKPRSFTADAIMMKGQQQTQLMSETARLEKNEAKLFEAGLYERDPVQAYSRVYAQIAKHDEMRDALLTTVEKYGRTPTEEELQAVSLGAPTGELYASKNGINAMIDARKNFMALKHDGMMSGHAPEEATIEALKEINDRALASFAEGATSADEIYAIPAHVAKMMDKFARPMLQLPPKASFFYSTMMNGWKTAILGLSPRWIVNNTLGNLVYMGVKDPGAIRYYLEMLMPKRRAFVEAAFGDQLTDVVYRDFMRGEMSQTTVAERAREAGALGTAQKLETLSESRVSFLAHPLKWMSRKVYHLNQINEDAARMGVAISQAQREAQLGWMSKTENSYKAMRSALENGFNDAGDYERVAKSIDSVLGDYLRMSPAEKTVKTYLMPFYPFYRHTAMFIARMPFETPFKAAILRQINQVDAEMKGALPDYMQNGAVNEVMPGWWLRIGNANPLSAVSEAYAPALTSPLLGLTIQRLTGTNPFGEPWRAPPGTLVEAHGGSQYEILRNPDGSYAGVRPVTGQWQPPLMEAIMGMVPQYGLITGNSPWKAKSFPLRALAMTGVSVSPFDQENYQYQAALQQIEALTAGASAAARY